MGHGMCATRVGNGDYAREEMRSMLSKDWRTNLRIL
jgi:hypothetical protein